MYSGFFTGFETLVTEYHIKLRQDTKLYAVTPNEDLLSYGDTRTHNNRNTGVITKVTTIESCAQVWLLCPNPTMIVKLVLI